MDPKNPQFRLRKQSPLSEQEETQCSSHTPTQQRREFESVEELLRFDAAQHPPPPRILERLRSSLAGTAPLKIAWWRRWFKR